VGIGSGGARSDDVTRDGTDGRLYGDLRVHKELLKSGKVDMGCGGSWDTNPTGQSNVE